MHLSNTGNVMSSCWCFEFYKFLFAKWCIKMLPLQCCKLIIMFNIILMQVSYLGIAPRMAGQKSTHPMRLLVRFWRTWNRKLRWKLLSISEWKLFLYQLLFLSVRHPQRIFPITILYLYLSLFFFFVEIKHCDLFPKCSKLDGASWVLVCLRSPSNIVIYSM